MHGLLDRALRSAKLIKEILDSHSNNIIKYLEAPDIPPQGKMKTWVPKNPEFRFSLRKEYNLSDDEWLKSSFPHRELPADVENHVNLKEWKMKVDKLPLKIQEACKPIMDAVLQNLQNGCDARIGLPGALSTTSSNKYENPEIDIPRIADAIASEIKGGNMAGPFPHGYVQNAKVNGFISVVKSDGSRRQVGNLSAPEGRSFNDAVDTGVFKEWNVTQTTSRDIADMILRAGKNAVLTCCDMTSAYKNLPVCLEQRRFQVFRFCGKEFVDLKLIFGDKSACMFYDRFHYSIVEYFVLPRVRIPRIWTGRTVDDLTSVVPSRCASMAKDFVKVYREAL